MSIIEPTSTIPPPVPSIPCAVIDLDITQFRSLGAITPLEAEIVNDPVFLNPDGSEAQTSTITVNKENGSIQVTSDCPVRLVFNIIGQPFVLVGVAWATSELPRGTGASTFPEVQMLRDKYIAAPFDDPQAGGSSLTIMDIATDPGFYDYVLMIQSEDTSEIGVFDPGMDNDPPR